MGRSLKLNRWQWASVLVCLAFLGWVLFPEMLRLPRYDENMLIYEGYLTGRGRLPYRDFFNFIWPATYWLVAVITNIWGLSLFALRMWALFGLILAGALTLDLGRQFLPRFWLGLLGLFFWFLHFPRQLQIQHHLFSSTMGVVVAYCLCRYVTTSDPAKALRWLIGTGVAIGVCALFTQSLGFFLAITTGLFVLAYWRMTQGWSLPKLLGQMTLQLVLPVLAPILLTCLYFWSQGAFGDFWYATFTWLFEGGYSETTSHYYFGEGFTKIPIRPWDHVALSLLLAALPVLGLLWPLDLAVQARKRGGLSTLTTSEWKILAMWAVGVGFFIAAFTFPTELMIALHGWWLYLLAGICLFNVLRPHRLLKGVLLAGMLVIFLMAGFRLLDRAIWMHLNEQLVSYGTVERYLYAPYGTSPEIVRQMNRLTERIYRTTRPEDTVYVYNIASEYNLLVARRNPTRHAYLLSLYNTPAQIAEATRQVIVARPAFIFYDNFDTLSFKFDERFAKVRDYDFRLRELEQFIGANYVQVDVIDQGLTKTLVYERLDRVLEMLRKSPTPAAQAIP